MQKENVNEQPESVPVIEEEIFGLHISQVQHGAFASEDYFVPEHHLVQRLTHNVN